MGTYGYGQVRPHGELLYDPSILARLDFTRAPAKFNPPISAAHPGPGLLVRPLSTQDYDKGYLDLLGQLTKVGSVTREQFIERFMAMKQRHGCYYVTVIEDVTTGRIVGAATLVVEHKFIHNCGLRGHLEDVVVNTTYRGKQLGKLIVTTISLLAREVGCYKITLECKDGLVKMYSSFGYVKEEGNSNSMNLRFDEPAFMRNKI